MPTENNPYGIKPIYKDAEFLVVAASVVILLALPAEAYQQVRDRVITDWVVYASLLGVLAGRLGIRGLGVIQTGRERAAAQILPPAPDLPDIPPEA